jgi:hypothetical protein
LRLRRENKKLEAEKKESREKLRDFEDMNANIHVVTAMIDKFVRENDLDLKHELILHSIKNKLHAPVKENSQNSINTRIEAKREVKQESASKIEPVKPKIEKLPEQHNDDETKHQKYQLKWEKEVLNCELAYLKYQNRQLAAIGFKEATEKPQSDNLNDDLLMHIAKLEGIVINQQKNLKNKDAVINMLKMELQKKQVF